MYKIYLASPLFTKEEKENCANVAAILRSWGFEVYVPMEHKIPNAYEMPNDEWGAKVFNEDLKALDECNEVVAIDYGLYGDTGTAWEMGYAFAKGKDVSTIVMNRDMPHSIMTVNGSDALTKEDCTYYIRKWEVEQK